MRDEDFTPQPDRMNKSFEDHHHLFPFVHGHIDVQIYGIVSLRDGTDRRCAYLRMSRCWHKLAEKDSMVHSVFDSRYPS